MLKYAMPSELARQVGRTFAEGDRTVADLKAQVIKMGYTPNGLSFQRVLRAYHEQKKETK